MTQFSSAVACFARHCCRAALAATLVAAGAQIASAQSSAGSASSDATHTVYCCDLGPDENTSNPLAPECVEIPEVPSGVTSVCTADKGFTGTDYSDPACSGSPASFLGGSSSAGGGCSRTVYCCREDNGVCEQKTATVADKNPCENAPYDGVRYKEPHAFVFCCRTDGGQCVGRWYPKNNSPGAQYCSGDLVDSSQQYIVGDGGFSTRVAAMDVCAGFCQQYQSWYCASPGASANRCQQATAPILASYPTPYGGDSGQADCNAACTLTSGAGGAAGTIPMSSASSSLSSASSTSSASSASSRSSASAASSAATSTPPGWYCNDPQSGSPCIYASYAPNPSYPTRYNSDAVCRATCVPPTSSASSASSASSSSSSSSSSVSSSSSPSSSSSTSSSSSSSTRYTSYYCKNRGQMLAYCTKTPVAGEPEFRHESATTAFTSCWSDCQRDTIEQYPTVYCHKDSVNERYCSLVKAGAEASFTGPTAQSMCGVQCVSNLSQGDLCQRCDLCGNGLFNLCDSNECDALGLGNCKFSQGLFGLFNSCTPIAQQCPEDDGLVWCYSMAEGKCVQKTVNDCAKEGEFYAGDRSVAGQTYSAEDYCNLMNPI